MKCLKNEKEIIIRVPENCSQKLVNSGKWEYCSKIEWKKQKKLLKEHGGMCDEWGRPPSLADVPLMPVTLYIDILTKETIEGVQDD